MNAPRVWPPLAAAAVLVVASALVGRWLLGTGVDIFLPFPPLLAEWLPHVGWGSPIAVVVAAAVIAGTGAADRVRWRPLLLCAWAAAAVWTLALALVDGWHRGVVERLSSGEEYLHDVPRAGDIATLLRTFTDHILTDQPGHWTTHVGAHPPGALLIFVGLDRIGLGGGGPAGLLVIAVGSSACVAVAVAVRALSGERTARRVLPFGVLLPGAVWVGVSADGLFAAVLAWGVALLAIGATRRCARSVAAAVAGGLLLGSVAYLSYGLVLGWLPAAAVVVVTRAWRAALLAGLGAVTVVVAFTAAGFSWFTGFELVRVIYAASIAQSRPYAYFVWANLAAVAFAAGPAVIGGLRHLRGLPVGAALLALSGVAAVLLADVSGLSKGEVERIWLPFVVWTVVACAALPGTRARWWLAAQVGCALAVNHLLLTVW
ncbi:hypothetical protein WEH80_00435 [Actinomycetes bacterium KLBMP 9759]